MATHERITSQSLPQAPYVYAISNAWRGGKCILNSTNYEDGDDRFFKVLELAKRYGSGVVVGTIDEDGMARTSEKKFDIAKRAYKNIIFLGKSSRHL